MRKIGIVLICLGLVLIAAATGFHIRNRWQEEQAAQSARSLLPQVKQEIERKKTRVPSPVPTDLPAFLLAETEDPMREMPMSCMDGNWYIGYLSIPALELELPVMGDWSYPQLKIAPCRYTGSLYQNNLVIMAHNYERHFGQLSKLNTGDLVTFTDMEGETVVFDVAALDILPPTAVEEMTAGDYDLTLFTCTYGGQSRVTLRCMRAAPQMP